MKKDNGRKFALWGAWLQLGALIGLIYNVIGVGGAFHTNSQNETIKAENLANEISILLVPTMVGMITSSVGGIFLAVALFGKKYRAPWFLCFLIVYGVLLAMHFPKGTFLGSALCIYLICKKNEFLAIKTEQGCSDNRTQLHA
jgi:hypothetical protein